MKLRENIWQHYPVIRQLLELLFPYKTPRGR
jgi:hypothetical protein